MIPLLLAAVVLLESPHHAKKADVDEFQAIRNRGHITAGIVGGISPPFLLPEKKGKPDGFSVRVAQHIADELGVELKLDFESKTFENLIDRLKNRQVDIALGGVTPTAQRALQVRFSDPIITGSLTALINRMKGLQYRGCPTLAQLAQLARKEGGLGMVERGSTIARFEKALPNAKIEKQPDHSALRKAVLEGRITAAVGSEVIARYFLQKNAGRRLLLELCPYPELNSPVAIGIRPDAPGLQNWLNTMISESGIRFTAEDVVKNADAWAFGWTDVLREEAPETPPAP